MKKQDKKALYEKIMKDISVSVKKTLNESYKSNEDRAAELYSDVLEEEGYENLDGLVSQIAQVFEFENLGVFEDDVHDAIMDAVCSLCNKYQVK